MLENFSPRIARLLALGCFATLAPGCFLVRGWKADTSEPEPKPAHVAKASTYEFPDADAPLAYAVDHWNAHQGDELRIDKVVVWDDQWRIIRTDAGIITRRDVPVRVFSDDPAGQHCVTSLCTLSQNEEGGSWSSGHLVCNRPEDATCDSVAALPATTQLEGEVRS